MPTREVSFRFRRRWEPTEDDRRLLDALAQRLASRDIAARLGITADAVEWQIDSLLSKAGLEDRDALTDWWLMRREQDQRGAPFWLLHSVLLSPIGAFVSMLVAGVAVVVMLLNSTSTPTPRGPVAIDRPDFSQRADVIRAHLAAVPAMAADGHRQASMIDLAKGRLEPFPFLPAGEGTLVGFGRWLSGGESLIVSWTGGGGLVERDDGRRVMTLTLPAAGFGPGVHIDVLDSRGRLLVWQLPSSTLSLLDPTSGEETTLVSMEGITQVMASPDARRAIFSAKAEEGLRLFLLDLESGVTRAFFLLPGQIGTACCLSWSPDGTLALITVGTSQDLVPNAPTWHSRLVVDTNGRVVWQTRLAQGISSLVHVWWAGPNTMFIQTGNRTGPDGVSTAGYLLEPVTGLAGAEITVPGVIDCFSPSGRYVLLHRPTDVARPAGATSVGVWDTASRRFVFQQDVMSWETGHCEWTQDEALVIVAGGGS